MNDVLITSSYFIMCREQLKETMARCARTFWKMLYESTRELCQREYQTSRQRTVKPRRKRSSAREKSNRNRELFMTLLANHNKN